MYKNENVFSFKLEISYKGDKFFGLQQQADGQAVINRILDTFNQVFGVKCEITLCGRTDSGVNGLKMPILLKATKALTSVQLEDALNKYLGADIEVVSCFRVFSKHFNVRRNVFAREYAFFVSQFRPSLFVQEYVNVQPSLIPKKLDDILPLIKGRHNFLNFANVNSVEQPTGVRTIYDTSVTEYHTLEKGIDGKHNIYCLSVVGQGFLYNMMRNLLGAIIKCCEETKYKKQLKQYLERDAKKVKKRFFKTEKATGLFFKQASYLYY